MTRTYCSRRKLQTRLLWKLKRKSTLLGQNPWYLYLWCLILAALEGNGSRRRRHDHVQQVSSSMGHRHRDGFSPRKGIKLRFLSTWPVGYTGMLLQTPSSERGIKRMTTWSTICHQKYSVTVTSYIYIYISHLMLCINNNQSPRYPKPHANNCKLCWLSAVTKLFACFLT